MTSADGQISLPPPEKQAEFMRYMQQKISSAKESGILDRLAGSGGGASSSVHSGVGREGEPGGPPPPSAHGYGDGLEATQAHEHRLGGGEPAASGSPHNGGSGEARSRSGGGVARSRSGARRDLSDP